VAREIERYRLPLTHIADPAFYVSLVDGRRLTGPLPVPLAEVFDLERLMYHVVHASQRLDSRAPLAEPVADLDIAFTDFIEPLALPRATYDYVTAFVSNMFGCAASEVSTLSVLSWVAAYDHSAIAVYLGESEMFAQGTRSAIEAMIRESGAEVRTSTPVRSVVQEDRRVTVTTRSGDTVAAAAVVVAVPLNVLSDLEFSPPLHTAKRTAATERHAGHMAKVWALMRGAPAYFYGAGQGPGMIWLATQSMLPEGNLMVGFGPDPAKLDVRSVADVQRGVDAFVPGAEVVKIDGHDWSADPYAKGTWVAYRPGQLTRFGRALREPEGRLVFAGSDFATKWAGWIEGAIASGTLAAEQASALLRP
jgi:monoamine oxidase